MALSKERIKTLNEVDDALADLRTIPTVLNLLDENFGLSKLELTKDDIYNLTHRHKMLSDVIDLTIMTITRALKDFDALGEKEDSDE